MTKSLKFLSTLIALIALLVMSGCKSLDVRSDRPLVPPSLTVVPPELPLPRSNKFEDILEAYIEAAGMYYDARDQIERLVEAIENKPE